MIVFFWGGGCLYNLSTMIMHMVQPLLSKEMDAASQMQILEETVFHFALIPMGKAGIHLFFFSSNGLNSRSDYAI